MANFGHNGCFCFWIVLGRKHAGSLLFGSMGEGEGDILLKTPRAAQPDTKISPRFRKHVGSLLHSLAVA
jgi:hypothetical protein